MVHMKAIPIILWLLVALTIIIEVPLFIHEVNQPQTPTRYWSLAIPLFLLFFWLSLIFLWHKHRKNL